MKIKFDLDLAGLLLTLFVILKLCHVINWSWWWVMAPMWLPISVFLVLFPLLLILRRL